MDAIRVLATTNTDPNPGRVLAAATQLLLNAGVSRHEDIAYILSTIPAFAELTEQLERIRVDVVENGATLVVGDPLGNLERLNQPPRRPRRRSPRFSAPTEITGKWTRYTEHPDGHRDNYRCAHCSHEYGAWSAEAVMLHCRESHREFYRRMWDAEQVLPVEIVDPRFHPL